MPFATVTIDREAPLAILRLNRPERLNAVSRELIEDVIGALDALEADADVRAIVLTGAGRAFCAGADLAERRTLDERAVMVHRKRVVVLFARKVPAAEALALGLVSRVLPTARLVAEARALATAIAENAPLAVRQAKRALDFAADHDFASSLAFETEAYHACVHTADRR